MLFFLYLNVIKISLFNLMSWLFKFSRVNVVSSKRWWNIVLRLATPYAFVSSVGIDFGRLVEKSTGGVGRSQTWAFVYRAHNQKRKHICISFVSVSGPDDLVLSYQIVEQQECTFRFSDYVYGLTASARSDCTYGDEAQTQLTLSSGKTETKLTRLSSHFCIVKSKKAKFPT